MGEFLDGLLDAVLTGLESITDSFPMPTEFQERMKSKFNSDLFSKKAIVQNITGREDLVKGYITDLYNAVDVGVYLCADYEEFRKHFVKYWRQALDIPRENISELKEIFDEELVSGLKSKNLDQVITFETGMAISADDLLDAVYEVLSEF